MSARDPRSLDLQSHVTLGSAGPPIVSFSLTPLVVVAVVIGLANDGTHLLVDIQYLLTPLHSPALAI